MERHYPTLDLIDRALMDRERALATAANAAVLERRARALADAYWSERVWLTGNISGPSLDKVVVELLALRIARMGPPISSPTEPVILPIRVEASREGRAA